MGLTKDMVIDYLKNARSLTAIDNHKVHDLNKNKTGQMLLTIKICQEWIDELLAKNEELLTKNETDSLNLLQDALGSLPSISLTSLYDTLTKLDTIQKNLLSAVQNYLENIAEFKKHALLLKTIVLMLKIVTYDLSKNPGAITKRFAFFTVTILSDQQRIENHAQAQQLLAEIIERFNRNYERDATGQSSPEMHISSPICPQAP